ncbi:hypothetical protein H2199_007713 [Coniosporium tulheliwenetii]|nr:hypothetical protein H2199_007713 [Cladosporium sp. JES 115]
MATTWGVVALQQIVKNMQLWAFRVLKPRISNYISQCRKIYANVSSVHDDSQGSHPGASQNPPADTSEPAASSAPAPASAPTAASTQSLGSLEDLPEFRPRFDFTVPSNHRLPYGASTSPDFPATGSRGRFASLNLINVPVQLQTNMEESPAVLFPADLTSSADTRPRSADAQPTTSTSSDLLTESHAMEAARPVRPTSAPPLATGGSHNSTRDNREQADPHTPSQSSVGGSQADLESGPDEARGAVTQDDEEDLSPESDPENDDFDDLSYVPSETDSEDSDYVPLETDSEIFNGQFSAGSEVESGVDQPDTPSRPPSTDSNVLAPDVMDGLETRALGALSGTQLIKLDPVKLRINRLTGEPLLNATWRALEQCLDPGIELAIDAPIDALQDILDELSGALQLPSGEVLMAEDIQAG